MSRRKQLCAVADCGLPAGFMCRLHWRLVPKRIRNAIHIFKRNGNADELQRAQKSAVAAVATFSGGGGI